MKCGVMKTPCVTTAIQSSRRLSSPAPGEKKARLQPVTRLMVLALIHFGSWTEKIDIYLLHLLYRHTQAGGQPVWWLKLSKIIKVDHILKTKPVLSSRGFEPLFVNPQSGTTVSHLPRSATGRFS